MKDPFKGPMIKRKGGLVMTPEPERPRNLTSLNASLAKQSAVSCEAHLEIIDHLSLLPWWSDARCSMLNEVWYRKGPLILSVHFGALGASQETPYWRVKLEAEDDPQEAIRTTLNQTETTDREVCLFAVGRLPI